VGREVVVRRFHMDTYVEALKEGIIDSDGKTVVAPWSWINEPGSYDAILNKIYQRSLI
jgi:hypothetical protein